LVSTKLDTFCYLIVRADYTVVRAVVLIDIIPACDRQIDRQTDRQADGIAIASTALAMRALRRAVKMGRTLGIGEGELGPHPTQCRLGRGVTPYQVASMQPFGRN